MFSGFELGRTVFTGAPLSGLCCRPEVGCPPNGCAAAAPNASRNASSGGGGGGGCVPKDNPCRAAFELYHQWYRQPRISFEIPTDLSPTFSDLSRRFPDGCGVWRRDKECPPRESWDPATTLWAVRGMGGGHWTSHDTGYNTVDNAVS